MAILGKWSGGTTTLLPTTTFAAPNAMFPTEDRNDSSTYSWSSSTSTVTLPSTIVADGYLLVATVEFEDTSNGRLNLVGRILQASGTGTIAQGRGTGYNRDNSEDRSYLSIWSFVHNPSASSTFQFQWKRDTDSPTGGTVRAKFEVTPLYYADWGLYTSLSTAATGGITPTLLPGFTGIDGTNITISSNVVTLAGTGKRYLCLGGCNFEGLGSARTQRWSGFRVDSVKDDSSKGCAYSRNSANDLCGSVFTNIIESDGTTTIDMFTYRGDGVLSGEGGADVDSTATATSGAHSMVFLELYDNCEVFKTTGSTNQNIATTGPIDLTLTTFSDINIADSGSWMRVVSTGMDALVNCDALIGANIGAASQIVSSGLRFTGYSEMTINGTEDPDAFHGNYLRGNQGSQDTFGWGANLLGFQSLVTNDTIGVSCTELTGSEGGGGAVHVQAGWAGFWGINLDTMEQSIVGDVLPAHISRQSDIRLQRM